MRVGAARMAPEDQEDGDIDEVVQGGLGDIAEPLPRRSASRASSRLPLDALRPATRWRSAGVIERYRAGKGPGRASERRQQVIAVFAVQRDIDNDRRDDRDEEPAADAKTTIIGPRPA